MISNWHKPKGSASYFSSLPKPLANGNTLISDQFNDQVIEITTTANPTIIASYETINSPGYSPSTADVLNAPYSTYVIDDQTGLTVPSTSQFLSAFASGPRSRPMERPMYTLGMCARSRKKGWEKP